MAEEVAKVTFVQSPEKAEKAKFVYDEFNFMMDEVMNKSYPEFNDRTLTQFLNDGEKRANSYTPTRAAQDKEDWQANVFSGTTRNKIRAYSGSMSKEPPKMRFVAVNEKNEKSINRANVLGSMVRQTYMCGNPAMDMLLDGWDTSIEGTIVKYDGYMLVRDKVEVITKYDPTMGTVEVEEVEEVIEDRHYEETVPLKQFLVRDPYVYDVQAQPAVCWARYIELEDFMYEFGHYPDADKVETKRSLSSRGEEVAKFFGPKLTERISDNKVEVLLYYRKRHMEDGRLRSVYRIVANGLVLFDGPLVWGRKKKLYPFAKTVFEFFANTRFFWGNSLPNVLMPHQDVENSLTNSMLDKTTRAGDNPLLVDMANKSQLELEDSLMTGDRRIYVNNVDGVKPLPVQEITQSEITMLKDVAQRLSLASVDALQEGYGQSGNTAREIVIANEKSAEIKGIFYLLLSDLWLQKTRLRAMNVLMHYSRPGNRYRLYDETLSTGERGTLEIRVEEPETVSDMNRVAGYSAPGEPFNRLDVFEEEQRIKGEPTEVIVVPPTYLDNWEYENNVMTETVFQKSRSLDMALEAEKLSTTASLFPEIFLANKGLFFDGLMRQFGDDPRKYHIPEPAPMPMPGMEAGVGGPLTAALGEPTKSLSALTEGGL